MTVCELYQKLDSIIPPSLSCEWDHDGLMVCPNPLRTVSKVLVCLDPSLEMAEIAIREGYDVILSHHPLLFESIHCVDASWPLGSMLTKLICAGVSVMCFHTRLDAVEGGVNDKLAELIGLIPETITPFLVEGLPMGRVGRLKKGTPLDEFVDHIGKTLEAPSITYGDAGLKSLTVALLGGSGKGEIKNALASGADTFLTGELGYHEISEADLYGINLIATGHYESEQPVTESLCGFVRSVDPDINCDIRASRNTKTWCRP